MAESIDPVEVKFSADTSGLKEGTNVASNSVKEAIDRINTSVVGMGTSITTNTAISGQALQGMAASVGSAMAMIGASISTVLLPITLLIAAWKALAGAVNQSIEDVGEVRGLMNSFGMASDKASELNVSLKLLGMTAQEYTSMALKLDRQVRSNEEGLNRMGVVTRGQNNQLLDQKNLLQNAVKAMMEYEAGTDRNAAAMSLFGRNSADAYKLARLNEEAMARGAEVAKRFGLVLGGEALDGARAYELKMNEMSVVWDSFKDKVGDVLMPLLVDLGETFIQVATYSLPYFEAALRVVVRVLDLCGAMTKVFSTVVVSSFEIASVAVRMFAEIVEHALKWDGRITESWEKGLAQIKALTLKSAQDIKATFVQLGQDLTNAGKATAPDTVVEPIGGHKKYDHQDKQAPSRMPEFEAELTQAKLAYQAENNLRDMSREREKQFWMDIKATHKLSKEEMLAIDKQIASLQLEINKKTLKDQEALTKESIESNEKAALAKVKLAEETSKMEVELGKKTVLQDLSAQQEFENQRYMIAQNAQAQRIALAELDPDNPVEKQKQLDKVLEIYQAHQLQMQKIQTGMVKESVSSYSKMLSPITNAISSSVQGMVQGTLTLQQAMRNMMQSILAMFTDFLAKMLQRWLAEQMHELFGMQTTTAAKQSLMAASAATTTATKATEATAVVGANAAEGASGAAASVASIPFIGWTMVAGVFASTMALIKGALGSISASGGYDVPAGVNPMAQLHAREMVLPASQADVIRNMASNGNGGGSANVHFNVSAMDADGVKKFFSQHKGAIAQTIKDSMRNGTNLTLANKYGRL